jgi:hypothetical protein
MQRCRKAEIRRRKGKMAKYLNSVQAGAPSGEAGPNSHSPNAFVLYCVVSVTVSDFMGPLVDRTVLIAGDGRAENGWEGRLTPCHCIYE